MDLSPSIFYMLLYCLAVKGDGCPPLRNCISKTECSKRLQLNPKWQNDTILYECGSQMVCCIENQNSQTPLQASPQTQVGATGFINNIKANLLPTDCGNAFSSKIVTSNGINTYIGEFPWMVLLNITDNNNNTNRFAFCGGSLINENYVLTAAHCIRNVLEGFTLGPIIIGEHNTLTEKDCDVEDDDYCADPIQIRSIKNVIVHENYGKPSSFKNDIALIRLNEKVNFHKYLFPICLPINTVTDETDNNYEFVLAGWGKTSSGNQMGSSILQRGSVTSIQLKDCNYNLNKNNMVDKTQICTASGSRVEACNGDSGGPLIDVRENYKTKKLKWHLIGIVSYTARLNSCGDDINNPTVYCRVEEYIDWILDKIEP